MARTGLTANRAAALTDDAVTIAARGRTTARALVERTGVPLLLATLALVLAFVPGIPPLCPLRRVLHVPCPSCGLTRAARLVLAGEWRAATRMHPLWPAVLPYVGLVGAGECAGYLRDGTWGRWTGRRAIQRVGLGIAVALVVVWIARQAGALGGPVPI